MNASHAYDIAIIVPVYDDDEALAGLLEQLAALRRHAEGFALKYRIAHVVVDGADSPATAELVGARARYLVSEAGRGNQIAAGIAAVDASWVSILHADTRLSAEAFEYLLTLVGEEVAAWGRFDVRMENLALVAWLMNWRSRLTRICTGDQAMFFATRLLSAVGGFPVQPLMEDIELSKRLKRSNGVFMAPRLAVQASPRRWRQRGVLRTIVHMWWMRLRYRLGASPNALYAAYYGKTL
jgi:rSAM/selenodomain-associated transferase 2